MDEDAIEELAGELPADVEPEEMDFEPVPEEYQPVVRAAMDYAKLRDELEALAEEWRSEAHLRQSASGKMPWDHEASGMKECARGLEEVLQQYE